VGSGEDASLARRRPVTDHHVRPALVKEILGMPSKHCLTVGGLLALALLSTPAAAQYPNKPITIIVPFAAGGPTDVVARLVGEHMSRTLGQTLLIENIGGAGGT